MENKCFCEDCGAEDPDCLDLSVPTSCEEDYACVDHQCAYPKGWTCGMTYGKGDECNCNCGMQDPDCGNVRLDVVGCGEGNWSCHGGVCVTPACGNGYVDAKYGEECELGGLGCSSDCKCGRGWYVRGSNSTDCRSCLQNTFFLRVCAASTLTLRCHSVRRRNPGLDRGVRRDGLLRLGVQVPRGAPVQREQRAVHGVRERRPRGGRGLREDAVLQQLHVHVPQRLRVAGRPLRKGEQEEGGRRRHCCGRRRPDRRRPRACRCWSVSFPQVCHTS